ncbi:MAG: hypothetical protein ABI277_03375 [Burkholderiaceae bacterium]
MTTNSQDGRGAPVHAPLLANLIALTTMCIVSSVAACAADAPAAPPPTLRVIVRFAHGVPDPQQPAFLARLASLAHVADIEAIRPMSGDAFVMRVVCTDPRDPHAVDPCPAALARLGSAEGVVGVEVDRRERIQ